MKSRHSREDASLAVDFYQDFLHAYQHRKELNIKDKKESDMYKFAARCKKHKWTFFTTLLQTYLHTLMNRKKMVFQMDEINNALPDAEYSG